MERLPTIIGWIVLVIALSGILLQSPSALANACPNEALRTELRSGQLPDCRAYEIASPPYTESALLTSVYAVSPEGTSLLVGSLGTFAGAEQVTLNQTNVLGAAYLLSRTATGWAATSIGPPSSRYRSGGGVLDSSTDLGTTLWALGTVGQPIDTRELYIERTVGTFEKIGPITTGPTVIENHPAYLYAGASEDISHVFFSVASEARWQSDKTVSEGATLYEYAGVEGSAELSGEKLREPVLVGVDEDGLLISKCGTRLGSSSPEEAHRTHRGLGSRFNAISASGAKVFFTAVGTDEATGEVPLCTGPPVDELFAREEVAGQMHTIAVSSNECNGNAMCEAASPADAHFEGASRDGSKVFFTSTQALLPDASDDTTSGDSAGGSGCTHTSSGSSGCNLYEAEFEPNGTRRLSLISGYGAMPQVQGITRISEDGSHVYFVAKGNLTGSASNERNEVAKEGADNLYLYQSDTQYPEGHISYIVTLSESDASDWGIEDERPVLASQEGRYLVFLSRTDLTDEGVAAGTPQVFQYDAVTGSLVRASIGQSGYDNDNRRPAVGSAIITGFPSSYSYDNADSPTMRDGAQAPGDGAVFFESPEALTPQALPDQRDFIGNPIPNIYEYRAGQVYLLSDGRDVSAVNNGPGSGLVGFDPSGENVFFFTSDPLIPGDGNSQQTLYDARVGGGFASPLPPASCTEACQGPLAEAPAQVQLGGSAIQAVETEIKPSVTPAATVKRKGKTVRHKPKLTSDRKPRAQRKDRKDRLHSRPLRHAARSQS
jgi:hypothetical protein